LLPRGRHPLAVLHLTVPPDTVDVNIHPAKAEVRLMHAAALGDALAEATRTTLGRLPALPPDDTDFSFGPAPLAPLPEGRAGSRGLADFHTVDVRLPESNLPALRIVGQLDGRLICAEGPDGLYLIDQHRAHERIIYEHLRAHAAHESTDANGIEPIVLALSP